MTDWWCSMGSLEVIQGTAEFLEGNVRTCRASVVVRLLDPDLLRLRYAIQDL